MPPRYAYWTILVDELPTAFRAATLEDIQPTFARLKAKNPTARLVWFQNGKVWNSRLDAQEAMRARGERGREGDSRQRQPERKTGERSALEWTPKGQHQPARMREQHGANRSRERGPDDERRKLDWMPRPTHSSADEVGGPRRSAKREGGPAHRSAEREGGPRPSRPRHDRPAWQPKGAGPRETSASRPGWKPKPKFGERRPRDDRKPSAPGRDPREKLEWRPKGAAPAEPREKRKWVPKEEYKKSKGVEAKLDKNWRPGGEHKDPRQKYKDAKKAKWSRFKQNVRKRWEAKGGKSKKERG